MKSHPPGHVTQLGRSILCLSSAGKLGLNLREQGAGAMREGAENEVSITGEKLDVDVVFEPSIPETTSAPYCWYDPMTLLFSEVCLYVSVCVCVCTPLSVHMYIGAHAYGGQRISPGSSSGMPFTSSETGSLIVLELTN